MNLIPKWNNPDDKTCVKRILKNRINFINEKIENAPVTAPENQIELGMLMNGGEFEFVQHNGAINYKDYSALPFSRTEQNFVCEAVKIGKYEKYNFNENKIEKKFKKEFEDKILSNMKGNGYFNDGYLDKIFLEKENYGSLEYSENYGKTGMPAYVFQINRIETKRRESDKLSPRTYYECKRDFMGVFYISGPGSFKLLGHASYPIQQIFNVDCGGGESFIIVDKKAYLATRDKNKNITQIDRLKSVECQNVGNVCDEQTFAMCKYPEGVK